MVRARVGRAAALEADAHRLFARGHELLAEAALARGAVPGEADALVSIVCAAGMAATSVRVLREAIRSGELPAYGGQRDRAVRMRDLTVWIESRRVTLRGPIDRDIERRMRRVAKRGAAS